MNPPVAPRTSASPDAGDARWYAAMVARDARFDGRFFVGVTSTGIYCRPICRVRTPLRRNCRFFDLAAGAEAAGFRPCLRCRPELAPGLSRVDAPQALAAQAARLIEAAAADGRDVRMPEIAARLGVTDRHLRRIFGESIGVPPLAYLNTRRLLQAKQMLTDTPLSVTQIAHASGFASLRRFNAAFAEHYRLSPSELRRQGRTTAANGTRDAVTVRLGYRPPYDISGMRRFLADRALPGVESVEGDGDDLVYRRTLRVVRGGAPLSGWTEARFDAARHELCVGIAGSLLPALTAVLERQRQAFDLDADPALIDPAMARLGLPVRAGLRLPGAVDGFESAVRVILGQQVTVAAARTLARRLVEAFGEPIPTPWPTLARLFPTPQAIVAAGADAIGRLGIVRQRVGALRALAQAVVDGRLVLDRAAPLEPTLDTLRCLPGIGEWTVQLIAMRVLAWPDAFPATDIGLLNALGTRDAAQAQASAEAWRPWRAYAVMRLWQTLEKNHD